MSQKKSFIGKTSCKVITVTNETNLYMGMCSIRNQRKRLNELSYDTIINKIDQAVVKGYSEIIFQGGEPFIREDMLHILQYAIKQHIKVSVISNLNSLSDSQTEQLCHIGIHRIIVEFPSTDRIKYSKLMNVNQRLFDIALENVLHLIVRGIHVEIRATVSEINKDEIPEIRNFFCSMGVEEKNIKFLPAEKKDNVISDKRLLYPDGQNARKISMNSIGNFQQVVISNF